MASFSWWWKLLNWEPAERRRLRRPRPGAAGARLWLESLEDRFAPSANHFLLNNYPASTTAGVANSFMVQALNPDNTVDTGYSGTDHFTSTDAQAVLPADYTFGATDSGKHTFSATLKTAGVESLIATDTVTGTLTGTESGISVSPAAAKSLTVGGFPSTVTAGSAQSFTVTAFDTYGNVATSYTGTVHITSTDSQATLPADYAFNSGDAGAHSFQATLYTAGSRTITATDTATSSITGKQSGITVNPAAANSLTLSGFPATVTAGSAQNFTVTAFDVYGNVATGYTGTMHITSTDSQAAVPADYTFGSTDSGKHTFSVTLKTAGVQSLTATDTVTATLTATESGISVSPAAAKSLTVGGFPSTVTAGSAQSFTVTAFDTYGNVATSYTGTVHITSTDSLATLPADYAFNSADAGAHSFQATLYTAGSRTITATDTTTSSITGKQSGITVNPATANSLTLSGFPATVTAGSAQNFTVTAFDPYGNLATGYTGTVHITSPDGQAVLPGDYTFGSTDSGKHTFSATLKTAGTQSLTATDTVTTTLTATVSGISVSPAAAKSLTVGGFPSTVTAGSAQNFTVTAFDTYGNVATGYTGIVHYTSSDSKAILPANYTFTSGDAGVHIFSATLKTAGSQSITATDTATSSITGKQSSITVNPAAANSLTLSGFPTSVTAGSSKSFTVTTFDVYGNVATGYTGTVHITSTDSQAALPADYTFGTTDSGKHTFSGTLKTAGTQSLTATDTVTAALTATESGISVSPATAKSLTVGGFPSTVTAGSAQNFTVTAFDAYGNVARGYTGTVHFTSTDSQATLPADYGFVAADSGMHTFSATLYTAGSRTITATDTASSSITGKQSSINVNSAAANVIRVTNFPNPTEAGVEGVFTVTAKDTYGNVATGYTGTVTFSSNDSQAVLPADYTFTSADAGVHNFTATLFTAGLRNIIATDTVNSTLTGTQGQINVQQPYFLYTPSTNTITVAGLVTATLSSIQSALPIAPLTLVDSINHIWLLDANLTLQQGATLDLYGTSIGGDVNQLRLRSNNNKLADGSEDPANTITVAAVYGNIEINSTKITSWDEAAAGPDINRGTIPKRKNDDTDSGLPTDTSGHVRSHIMIRSFFDSTGTIAYESRMDILNSDIGYLGSHANEAYGLSWKSLPVGPAAHALVQVFGDIENSHIHDNFFGVFTYGAYGMHILNNEVDHNVWYGLDPHDDSNNLDIEGNHTHDNGAHGIILSQRCNNAIIKNNVSDHNKNIGIMLHRSSNNAVVEGNRVTDNGQDGIALYESDNAVIDTNTVLGNNQSGIRMSVGSQNNQVFSNEIGSELNSSGTVTSATSYGVYFFEGSDTPTSGNGRPTKNVFHDNTLHDLSSNPIKLSDSDNNTFRNNQVTRSTGGSVSLTGCVGTTFTGNTFTDAGGNTIVQLIKSVADTALPTLVASLTYLTDQVNVKVSVDATSTVVLTDSGGHVFNLSGVSGLATTAGTGSSSLTLTQANIGSNTVQVKPSSFQATTDSGTASVQFVSGMEWKTTASSSTQALAYTLGGLAANTTYTIKKNGVALGTFTTDANGVLRFTDVAGSLSPVDYTIG